MRIKFKSLKSFMDKSQMRLARAGDVLDVSDESLASQFVDSGIADIVKAEVADMYEKSSGTDKLLEPELDFLDGEATSFSAKPNAPKSNSSNKSGGSKNKAYQGPTGHK